MGEVKEFPNRLPTDAWVSKKQLAGILDRSIRWVEMRMQEGMPSQLRRSKRVFHLGAALDWLELRDGQRSDPKLAPAEKASSNGSLPVSPEEQRFAELESRVTQLERDLAELKTRGEPGEPEGAA